MLRSDIMRRFWPLAPLLLLLANCSRPPDVQSLQSSVTAALQGGELEQAQTLLDAVFGKGALQSSPASPDTLLAAGVSQPDADRLRLLQSEILLEQGKAPDAMKLLGQIREPGDPASRLRWMVNRAVALARIDKVDQATALLDQFDRESGKSASSETVLKANLLRGSLLLRSRQFGPADALFREAAATAQETGLPFYRAAALLNLSVSSLRRLRYDESVEYSLQALESGTRAGHRQLVAAMHNNLGIAYYRLGNLEQAEQHATQSIEQSRKAGDTRTLANALGGLANVYMELGKAASAVDTLGQAVDMSKRIGANSEASRWAGNLATAHLHAKSWDAAEHWNRESYRFNDLVDHPEKPLLLRLNEAEIAVGRGQFDKAEQLYRALLAEKPGGFLKWDGHARLGSLYAARKRYPEAKREYVQALAAIEDQRANLNRPESQLTFHDHLIQFFENYVDLLVSEGRHEQALEVVEYSRARVMAEKLGMEAHAMDQVRASAFQAHARRTGDALLSYWLAPDRSFVWVVNATGIHMSELPGRARIAEAISVYRRIIEKDLRDPVASGLSQGETLSGLLLGPVQQHLRGASRVIVVPDDELHLLNLETLPQVSPAGPRYWIEAAEFAVAPSLVVLSESPAARKAAAKPSLLLFGAATSTRKEYPELPGAKSEIDGIRQVFAGRDQTVRTGRDATPRGFLEATPANYSMIHFAAHAEANPQSPLDSAVILSDDSQRFKLYARDIADLKLTADLVSISACRSAGARSYSGEGLVGFAWAFLQSGARTVIAGLWDVDDNYSAQVMTTLYRGIESGLRPSTALRAAKLELLQSGGLQRKPVYWAPYQAYLR
jgi:CHAT domain-containing protein